MQLEQQPLVVQQMQLHNSSQQDKFDLFDVADIFKSTPYIADLKPGGRYVAKIYMKLAGASKSSRDGYLNTNFNLKKYKET